MSLIQLPTVPPPDNWFGFILQMTTVMMPFLMAWVAYKQLKNGQEIKKLETNTNSIKDALVAATAKGALAEGNLAGREQLLKEQATPAAISPDNPMSVKVENKEAIKVQSVEPAKTSK